MNTKEKPTTREQWLAKRRQGIGSSDAAAVLGLSPYASPMSLFLEKTTGESVEDDSEIKEIGLLQEPIIASLYEKRTGRTVIQPTPFTIFEMPSKPYLLATPDRLIVQVKSETRSIAGLPLELKATSYFEVNDEDELPRHWLIQLQHQMMVLGVDSGSFGVLVSGRRFVYRDIERNEAFCSLLLEKEEEFWMYVQKGTPPPVDGHHATTEALKRLWPKETGEIVYLPQAAEGWTSELSELEKHAATLDGRITTLKNKIRASLGDASIGKLPDGTGWTLHNTKRKSYTVQETEYRKLQRVTKLIR